MFIPSSVFDDLFGSSNGDGGYVNQLPTISTPNMSTGGAPIQSGGSWLNDLLNTLIYTSAIGQGATHIPTTAQPVSSVTPQQGAGALQQQLLLQQQLAAQQASAGGKFGDSIQKFISENTGLLLAGGLALVLFRSGRK